jgi:uncharacterized membrane protein HdeD (DUF308 family)
MTYILSKLQNNIKHWYIPLIIGILFILLGIYISFVPLATYLTLSIFFSISFLVSGMFDILFSIQNQKRTSGWGWHLVSGIIAVILGLYLIANPGISLIALPYVVGFGLLFRSAYMLGVAFDYRSSKLINGTSIIITSILGLILSFLLIANPLIAGFSLVYLTAFSFIFTGIAAAALAFDLKKLKNKSGKISDALKQKIEQLQKEVDEHLKK